MLRLAKKKNEKVVDKKMYFIEKKVDKILIKLEQILFLLNQG